MDDEPPMYLAQNSYKGPASIPHVPMDFFSAYFLAAGTSMLVHMFPGRFFGVELRARKFDPDYLAALCNHQGMLRQSLHGKVPRSWKMGGPPRNVTDSWEHMWWDHLHWKRWKVPRLGPAIPQDMYWQ